MMPLWSATMRNDAVMKRIKSVTGYEEDNDMFVYPSAKTPYTHSGKLKSIEKKRARIYDV